MLRILLLTLLLAASAGAKTAEVVVRSAVPVTLSWSWTHGDRHGHAVSGSSFQVPIDEANEIDVLAVASHSWLGSQVDRVSGIKLQEGPNPPVEIRPYWVFNPLFASAVCVLGFPACLLFLRFVSRRQPPA